MKLSTPICSHNNNILQNLKPLGKNGSLQQFIGGTVGREQDSEAKVYGFKPWSGQKVTL